MTIAKKVLLDELDQDIHPEKVEDVIFWALEHYAKSKKGLPKTFGVIIAGYLVDRINEEEAKHSAANN